VPSAEDLNWLITAFAQRVPSVAHAAIVSASGLPLASSDELEDGQVDQLGAIASGLISLVQGAARLFEGGPVAQLVVVMEQGMLVLKLISDTSVLAVLATDDCDLGLVSYEMVLLGEQADRSLIPEAHRRLSPDRRDPRP
jgi:predicted regulator of Ras-like GTPase activity (Roadblock/LC7/MglB family)